MNAATTTRARWPLVVGGVALVIVIALAVCEAMGWPFLAAPMERMLGHALDRRVSFHEDPSAQASVSTHLLGGIRVSAPYIEIGAPEWSKEPHMLLARDASLKVGYFALWRASRGEPLHIKDLRASALDGRIERLADGRATWQFGKKTETPDTSEKPTAIPTFGRLEVDSGTATYRDALMVVDLDAVFSLTDGSRNVAVTDVAPAPSALASAASSVASVAMAAASHAGVGASTPMAGASQAGAPMAAASAASGASGFQLSAKGTYQKNPVTVGLNTSGVLPVLADDAATIALPVTMDAKIGGARLTFRGTATDVLHLTALKGRFSVAGPSLAAVGDPLNVTLPTTGAFRTDGLVAKDGLVWNAVFDEATIGSSRLAGAFQYDPRSKIPVLSGRLTGTKLLLADLGPAVGTSAPDGSASSPVASRAASSSAASASASASASTQKSKRTAASTQKTTTASAAKGEPTRAGRKALKTTNTPPKESNDTPGRVLPDREFDLPSLRAMNANVLIDIDNLDLGSSFLEPLKPLRAHLVLADGVLSLQELEARTGQGRLFGMLQLDGRSTTQALWNANLHWDGIRLESWIHQTRSANAPPYLTGNLAGQARVAGQGKSTAAILGSLRGGVRMELANGTVSHLAVEAAGLDIAQGLGMLIKGDDSLPLQCTVADFIADQGVLKPRAFLIDTRDSVLWIDGTVSLANEGLDLKVTTEPRDFSPLAVRTPVRLRGTFADPHVSLETSKLAPRVGAAALLSLLNPLAALIPFIDPGSNDAATKDAQACHELSQRIAAKPSLPAPPSAKAPPRATIAKPG